jgi:LPS-assembly protein
LVNLLKNNLLAALLSLIIGFLLCSPLLADEATNNKNPVNIDADTMDYDNTSEVYHAQGSVVVTYQGGVLTADDVAFDKKNNVATASGNALLKMGEDTLAGDRIVFNVESKTGIAYKGRAFYSKNHFYIRGDEIEKTGELTYKIIQPVATTCDGDNPDWEIAGSEMKMTIEGYGFMKNARFVAASKVPVFYSPFLAFPAKTKRQSGFLFPYLSYSKDKDGIDIEVPYYWAISPQMDATFYQRYIEKRGWKEGAEFRYYAGEKSFGTFYGDYLEDNKHNTDTTAASGTASQDLNKRWSYYLNHQTNFDSRSYIRTDLRRVSDNWYFRDFSAHNYYLDHYALTEKDPFRKIPFLGDESLVSLESTARLYKGWSNYNLTALYSSTDNLAVTNNDSTLQKYPEITFTAVKQPLLKSPLYYEYTAVYDYFYRGQGQRGHFVDFNPTFSVPFNISRYAKVIPQIAFRETFWSRDDEQAEGDSKQGTRSIYNFSLALSSQVSRVFDVNVQNWEKIRHEIKPEITYAYTPYVPQSSLPDFAPIVAPTVTPIVAAATNAIMEQNAVAVGVTNTFTAKQKDAKGAYSYLEFLRIKLFQTYDINEAKKEVIGTAERHYLSDMGVEVDFRPHPYLSFAARNQYSVYNGWTVANYDLSINDWRGDSATFSYRYTLNSIEEIDIYLKAVITEKLSATFISRRDQFNSRTIENTVGLVYQKQCWAVGLDYTKSDSLEINSAQPVTDTRFVLKLSLTGLGIGRLGF